MTDVVAKSKRLASIKQAEVLSVLGAGVLGAGLALLAPDAFGPYVYWLIGIGIAVHGLGMSAKHRLEVAQREQLRWERVLFAVCWVVLAALIIVAVIRALGYR
ncbi:MAG: hypothetical protein RJA99_4629 [Pseudomonadota bacterium]